mmetsp:Transcript_2558/g.4607  ORF Transcript_2558/g.4607 Transcript_2558/m.4607 type:complete len:81 (-) Transcript_2558:3690-3932(-)
MGSWGTKWTPIGPRAMDMNRFGPWKAHPGPHGPSGSAWIGLPPHLVWGSSHGDSKGDGPPLGLRGTDCKAAGGSVPVGAL